MANSFTLAQRYEGDFRRNSHLTFMSKYRVVSHDTTVKVAVRNVEAKRDDEAVQFEIEVSTARVGGSRTTTVHGGMSLSAADALEFAYTICPQLRPKG